MPMLRNNSIVNLVLGGASFRLSGSQQAKVFSEINKLREEHGENDEDAKERQKLAVFSEHTLCGRIARNKKFEYITLAVIVFNALYLGYDCDYSARWGKPDDLYSSDMPWGFPFMENLFCIFFTFELLVRFIGYVNKCTATTDIAFLFDFVLVALMIAETWVLAVIGVGGALSQFSILRLLRLVRIARMGKLIRYFPELGLIVKGMLAACRSVGISSILLLLVLYVFSIMFATEYHQGWRKDSEIEGHEIEFLFGSIGKSMRHLLIMGTILDDITACMNAIRSTEKIQMVFAFCVLVIISAFTLFNMLLGILCEVVEATGSGEKAKAKEKKLKDAIMRFFITMDMDGNGEITREEFAQMEQHDTIMSTLSDLNIDGPSLQKYEDLYFDAPDDDGREKKMTGKDCVAMIMKLRPDKGVNSCDFAFFKKKLNERSSSIRAYLDNIEWIVEQIEPEESEWDEEHYEEHHEDAIVPVDTSQGQPKTEQPKTERRSTVAAKKRPQQTVAQLAKSPAVELLWAPPRPESDRRWRTDLAMLPEGPNMSPRPPTAASTTSTSSINRPHCQPESDYIVRERMGVLRAKKIIQSEVVRDTAERNAYNHIWGSSKPTRGHSEHRLADNAMSNQHSVARNDIDRLRNAANPQDHR